MNNYPPKFWLSFFRWYCHPDFAEDIEGDLLERFDRKANQRSLRSAKWGLTRDVIRLFRPDIIRPLFSNQRLNDFGMLKNYFTIATRSLLKQKLYSAINIGGLTVGLVCFITIFIYVQHELSYDNFYAKKDNIHRIYQRQVGNEFMGSDYFAVTPAGLASVLADEYSEVEKATSVTERSVLLTVDKSSYFESGLWANHEFFNVFDYEFMVGNSQKVFEQPTAIVLTTSFANKIFGKSDVLGESVTVSSYWGDQEFTVTGVIKDLPENSSFQFTHVINLQSNSEYVRDSKSAKWNNNSYQTFFLLNPDSDPMALQEKLPALVSKYSGTNEDYPFRDVYHVQRLSQLHLASDINFDIGVKGNIQYLILFSGIAIIVLVLACVNYMNLAIARSIQRAKEVGLRKVIGAVRSQLIGQFLGESVFITFMALVLALGLSYWFLPYFGAIIERPLSLSLTNNPLLIPILSGLILLVGLFSGSYPAIFMSSLKPINTLKGRITNSSPKMKLQSVLVIIQYSASIILIISSLVIYLQFDFIQNKELGYDKDHIIVVNTRSSELKKNIDPVKTALLKHSSIISITTSNSLPSNIGSSSLARLKEEGTDADNIAIYRNSTDYDYLKTFGMELVSGRYFSPDIESDEDKAVINETAAKTFGWTPEEAVGNKFFKVGDDYVTVIGVVKDFHMFSMHLAIQPLMITLRKDYFGHASIKVKPGDIQNTIALIEETVQEHSRHPFDFQFMDAEFDKLYKADIKLGKIFGTFTALSILIASLGLFGLAAYTAEQRTKEIGIRKVLGASVRVIVGLITRDFLRMVLIGFIFAVPVAWFAMDVWLQDYAYHITLEWWIFAVAGVMATAISILTISSQSIKASIANPVDSLRSE